MQSDTSSGNSEEPPASSLLTSLKQFHSAGRGFWKDVSASEWNDWKWQLKHRITSVEQLQRFLPTLTPEEYAGATLANHKLALAITPYFFNLIDPADENGSSASQRAHDILIPQRLCRRALEDDLAAVDHINAVGNGGRAGEIGFGQQEGDPEAFDHHNGVTEALDRFRAAQVRWNLGRQINLFRHLFSIVRGDASSNQSGHNAEA